MDNFLFNYRNTPCTSTQLSPVQIIFKQMPRTKLNMLRPKFEVGRILKDTEETNKQKSSRDFFTEGKKMLVYEKLEKK